LTQDNTAFTSGRVDRHQQLHR